MPKLSPPTAMRGIPRDFSGSRGGYVTRPSVRPPAAMTAPKTGTGLITPTPRRQPSVPDKAFSAPPRSYSGGTKD
jgi:hypothetical protein